MLIRKSVVFLLLLLLAGTAFSIQGEILCIMQRTLPQAMVYRANGTLSARWEKLAGLEPEEGTTVTLAELRTGMVFNALTDREIETVDFILTDSGYPDAVPLELLYGTFFTVSEVPEENRFLVISDRLAIRFFLTDRVVGRTLRVDGLEFQVCGVYRSGNSLWEQISSAGRETVYLPYSALPVQEPGTQLLYVKGSDGSFAESVTDGLETALGTSLGYQTMGNYSDSFAIAAFFQRAAFFFCGLALIGLLAVLAVRQGRLAVQSAILQGDRRAALRPGIIALCGSLLIVVALLLICFSPELPPRLLPADNIFDFGFYAKEAVTAMQTLNGSTVADFYWRFSQNMIIGSAVWGCLSVVAFYPAFFYGVSLFRWLRGQL